MANERILVVDDEQAIRELIQLYLQNEGYDVLTAKSGKEAVALAYSAQPDLILLDIEMPTMNGFDVCEQIREQMTLPIIFLSCRTDVQDKVKCLELGGDDYVTKPFEFEELKARIQANVRRYHLQRTPLDDVSHIVRVDDLELNMNTLQCTIREKSCVLKAKEMELLIHLMSHANQIWSAEQLYDQIWGRDSTGSLQTVKVHISRLRSKLEADPANPQYIQTVRGFGYLFHR